MNTKDLFSRACSNTNEGMNEGWVWNEGEKYFKYEADLIKHLRSLGDEGFNEPSDEFILNESYNLEEHYYTEWDLTDDAEEEAYDKDGNLYTRENPDDDDGWVLNLEEGDCEYLDGDATTGYEVWLHKPTGKRFDIPTEIVRDFSSATELK